MLRSILSAVVLAGVIAAARPVLAEPVAATVCDQVQAASPAAEHPAPPPPARASASDAPANAGIGQNIVFVGLGWG